MGACVTGCCCNCNSEGRASNTQQRQSQNGHGSNRTKEESITSKGKFSKHISASISAKAGGNNKSISPCSRAGCTVIHDLLQIHFTFMVTISDNDYELQLQIDRDFEHYLTEHVETDNRSINKCADKQCLYEKNKEYNYSAPFSLSNHQRIHAYFYHSAKYQKLKTQRSHKFMQNVDDPNNLIDDDIIITKQDIDLEEEEDDDIDIHTDLEFDDDDMKVIRTGTDKRPTITPTLPKKFTITNQSRFQYSSEGSYNLSTQISRLLIPGLNREYTRDEGEEKEKDISQPPSPTHIFLGQKHEFCEESTNCNKIQQLIQFCENIDPDKDTKEEYDEELMKTYWDHYCESHLEEYKKLDCIHIINDDQKDHEDEIMECIFLRNSNTKLKDYGDKRGNLQILLHRHFYHENIMKEENNRIKYVKETMHGQKIIDKFKPTMNAILSSANKISQNKVLEFGFPFECEPNEAKFKNPKEEILKNTICPIQIKHWNQLFNKCSVSNGYSKALKTRQMKLKLKEVIVLKLYTGKV